MKALCPYLFWRTRRPRLVTDFRIRRAAWPQFSGRETLAAAISRSRCVLLDGCPVLSVHRSFGLALHIGQRTDNMCPNVSFSAFTLILFSIAILRHGQSCSLGLHLHQSGNRIGKPGSLCGFFQRNHLIYRNDQSGHVQTFRATCSKSCRPLFFFQEFIKPVSSEDLDVISLFHGGSLLWLLGPQSR